MRNRCVRRDAIATATTYMWRGDPHVSVDREAVAAGHLLGKLYGRPVRRMLDNSITSIQAHNIHCSLNDPQQGLQWDRVRTA